MTKPSRLLRPVALAAALAAAAATSACSGGDTEGACRDIQARIQEVSSKGLQQVSDPQALAKTYSDGAAAVRSRGKDAGGDVESAAGEVATALESLGRQVAAESTQQPDTGSLISAGTKLQKACNG